MSETISGSASSRCGSAGTAAEKASPWALAELTVVLVSVTELTVSVPVYGCGTELTKPQAITV